ncbi:hypothetical protein CDAR_435811 [Caerostris darwini]|uniref:Uncharacterized protein n=1 Tax=Caerostris darwini TaxID=1538125 RepID=A0AAV4PMK8_9ARAC|nr:hypothetical protein CDAR_435811 [Caerostris darwini]
MSNDLAVQLKLMRPISKLLSIQIVIASHVRLQRSSMFCIHSIKKNYISLAMSRTNLAISIFMDPSSGNSFDEINICDSPLKCNEIYPFLKRLIAGDEKWIVYNDVNRKRS